MSNSYEIIEFVQFDLLIVKKKKETNNQSKNYIRTSISNISHWNKTCRMFKKVGRLLKPVKKLPVEGRRRRRRGGRRASGEN